MDPENAIVTNQLGANSEYISITRQVKRKIVNESLPESLRNETDLKDVYMSNNNQIVINTGTMEFNTPSQKAHNTTINTTVNHESSDVSSPTENGFKMTYNPNDLNYVEINNNIVIALRLISIQVL